MRTLAWIFVLLCLTIAGLLVGFSPTGIALLVIAFMGWVALGIRQMVQAQDEWIETLRDLTRRK